MFKNDAFVMGLLPQRGNRGPNFPEEIFWKTAKEPLKRNGPSKKESTETGCELGIRVLFGRSPGLAVARTGKCLQGYVRARG